MIVPPILFGIAFVLLWQWFVIARDIKPYLLPKPSDIWSQIHLNRSEIITAARNTGINALVGLVCGTVAGVAMAFLASRFRVFSDMSHCRVGGGHQRHAHHRAWRRSSTTSSRTTSAIPGGSSSPSSCSSRSSSTCCAGSRQVDPVHPAS